MEATVRVLVHIASALGSYGKVKQVDNMVGSAVERFFWLRCKSQVQAGRSGCGGAGAKLFP